ncbi:uncharacterized protein [Spinacia oleracea]|uniref:Uncharacterized protein isoform X2 n=2 Tax=Spinacia oleracea TaxID=3562 RepID=A0ABM3QU66_SPIOL|nr:uncharacterized protein LOC110800932 isoform X2 [Spinacia oleracea]XP_056686906.1 uncharacterized protein LOC110800932 isoform X2 [Spinacia oleracea]XP_056693597.1 uncharacterized protein LOC110788750 isoform X2 [Spinacia oleracea]XP_056693598.1 uncharacterized protein LOC110788750 isoform X2 [Spinacia oleracea]
MCLTRCDIMGDIGILQIVVGFWWLHSFCMRMFVLQLEGLLQSVKGGMLPVIDCCAAVLLCLAVVGSVSGVVLLHGGSGCHCLFVVNHKVYWELYISPYVRLTSTRTKINGESSFMEISTNSHKDERLSPFNSTYAVRFKEDIKRWARGGVRYATIVVALVIYIRVVVLGNFCVIDFFFRSTPFLGVFSPNRSACLLILL